jgi:nitrogen fixation protein FixH
MKGGLKGWHVLTMLLGFFLFVSSVNGVMIYFAVGTLSGENSTRSYDQGLRYNNTIREAEAQERLGWRDETKMSEDGRTLELMFTDKDGAPLSGLTVNGILGRPAVKKLDREVKLDEAGSGHYRLSLAGVEPGAWVLMVSAQRAGEPAVYRLKERVWVKPAS